MCALIARAHFNAITFSVPRLTLTRDGYFIRVSEDIGAVRRFPLALLMQHNTPGPRRALRESSRPMKATARSNGAAKSADHFISAGVRRRFSEW